MFDPQGLYSRRIYDSRKGQVIQKKGSKANKEIDLNSIPRFIEFLRNNGYYISEHVPRCPVYIDRYIDVELTSTNYYQYIDKPIQDTSEATYFNLSGVISSSMSDIRGKYDALMAQIDDITEANLTFNVKNFNYTFANAQSGGNNYVSLQSTVKFLSMINSVGFLSVIKPVGQDPQTAIGLISRFVGGVFAFVDTAGNTVQFSTQIPQCLASYSTNITSTIYAYLAEGILPVWQFGLVEYDITNVDRQMEYNIRIYIEVIANLKCKIEPRAEE